MIGKRLRNVLHLLSDPERPLDLSDCSERRSIPTLQEIANASRATGNDIRASLAEKRHREEWGAEYLAHAEIPNDAAREFDALVRIADGGGRSWRRRGAMSPDQILRLNEIAERL